MEIAKWLVAFVAVMGFGGFIADIVVKKSARQHVNNPAWPPHAKFHNVQGVLMGVGLGVLSLVILFSFDPLPIPVFLIAVAASAIYWVAALIAPIVPGTAWTDPEFAHDWPHPLGLDPQHFLALIMCGLLILSFIIPIL